MQGLSSKTKPHANTDAFDGQVSDETAPHGVAARACDASPFEQVVKVLRHDIGAEGVRAADALDAERKRQQAARAQKAMAAARQPAKPPTPSVRKEGKLSV